MTCAAEHPAGPAYRAWLANGGTASRHMDPFEAMDAAHECEHGRLAHDAWRDPACTCWKVNRTPDLMGVLKRAEEAVVDMDNNDILNLARERGELRRADLVEHFACTPEAASKALGELVQTNALIREGERGGTRYLVHLTLDDEPAAEEIPEVPLTPEAVPSLSLVPTPEPEPATTDPIRAAMRELEERVCHEERAIASIDETMDRLHAQLSELAERREAIYDRARQFADARDVLANVDMEHYEPHAEVAA